MLESNNQMFCNLLQHFILFISDFTEFYTLSWLCCYCKKLLLCVYIYIYIWKGFPCSHLESTQLCSRFNLDLDVSSSNFPKGFFLSGDFSRIFSQLCNFSTAVLGTNPILAAALGTYPILVAALGPRCSLRQWICHLGSHSLKSLWKIPNTHKWWAIHLKSRNTKKVSRRTIFPRPTIFWVY